MTGHLGAAVGEALDHFVIAGVGCRFVQDIDGLSVQGHEVAFEAEVADGCDVLIAI